MGTNINITIDYGNLVAEIKRQQDAARLAQVEKEKSQSLEKRASDARTTELEAKGQDADGNTLYGTGGRDPGSFSSLGSSGLSLHADNFSLPTPARRPIARRFGTSYYWLAVRAWWFDRDTFNDLPPAGKALADIAKVINVYIEGKNGSATYQTIGDGGNSVLNLLNGTDSSSDTFYSFPYLPEGTAAPTGPYLSQMSGPRKTLENAESGTAEFDPSKYTILHTNQLPIFEGGSLTFHKPFYNIYMETLDTTKISFATQPKKFTTAGGLAVKSPVNHGVTFDTDNSTLFDVGHAYLIGRYETGTTTVKPIGTSNTVHVFVQTGRNKNGFYSLISSGTSRFAVDDLVYWHNYSLYPLEPQIYRYGTITGISRGTFNYTNNNGNLESFTGLRIVLELSANLTLDFSQYYQLFNSTIVKPFSSVEDALASSDSLWVDQFRFLGGFANEWVVETTEGETIDVPELSADFVGDSYLWTEKMDCSKNGKAYFIQSAHLSRDTPTWRRQENYHDGDFVAQRPGLEQEGSSAYQTQSVVVKFLELNCASNAIIRTFTTQLEFPFSSNADAATIEAMPDWFPSKRYRQAGFYSASLNLNKDETKASRISSSYDAETETIRYYIKSWPLDQSLPIEEIVQMLFNEADYEENEITDLLPELNTDIQVSSAEGPARWGYTYTTEYLVSL